MEKMERFDPEWIVRELQAMADDYENALPTILQMDADLLNRKNAIELAFEHEIPEVPKGDYASLTVVGGYYTREEIAAHLRELFLKAYLDVRNSVAVPGEPDWLYWQRDFEACILMMHEQNPDCPVHPEKIDEVKELYPTIVRAQSESDMEWFREHILTLPEDTLCFFVGSFGPMNSTWLIIRDELFLVVESDWSS